MGGQRPVGLTETCPGQAQAFFNGRAEPAPPRGASPARVVARGKPWHNAQGGFLGGARSLRPCGKALLMPRHFITRDGWPKARNLMEICLGQAQAFFNGRAEPAPSEVRWPLDIGLQEKGPGEDAMGQIPLNYRFLLTQVSLSPII